MEKVYYYKDEINDDFSGSKIVAKKIDENYKYIHKNIFWNILSFILYRFIATPIAYIYCKIRFGLKIENRKVLKECRKQGYFIYINHTQEFLDPFLPTFLSFPKKAYVIANADNVSIPFIGKLIEMLGALALPSDLKAGVNFLNAIKKNVEKEKCIAIYPEAHIWPYYTKIRDFKTTSFKYPIKFKSPVFCATVTYIKRKRKTPKIKVYVDGPFYANGNLKGKEMQDELGKRVYDKMVERAKNSNVEYIKYKKMEEGI